MKFPVHLVDEPTRRMSMMIIIVSPSVEKRDRSALIPQLVVSRGFIRLLSAVIVEGGQWGRYESCVATRVKMRGLKGDQ